MYYYLNFKSLDFKPAPHDELIPFDFNNNNLSFIIKAKRDKTSIARVEFWTKMQDFVKGPVLLPIVYIEIIYDYYTGINVWMHINCDLNQQKSENQISYQSFSHVLPQYDIQSEYLWEMESVLDGERVLTIYFQIWRITYNMYNICNDIWKANFIWVKFVSAPRGRIPHNIPIKKYLPEVRKYTNCSVPDLNKPVL